MAAGGLSSVANYAVYNTYMGNEVTLSGTVSSFVTGAVVAGLFYGADKLIGKGVNFIKDKVNSKSVDSFIRKNVNSNFQKNVKDAFTSDVKLTQLSRDKVAYRYHGGDSQAKSYWYTPYKTSNPASALALPKGNTYSHIDSYIIPKGTFILEGTVAPNFGQSGGGYQYYVSNPSVVRFK